MKTASAQADVDDPWTEPINLSNSSGAGEPRLVVDASGIIHVVWQDEFTGTAYTYFADSAWSDPVTVELPFEEDLPTLVATPGFIHAFWISQNDDTLLHSRVTPESFAAGSSWSVPTELAQQVAGFSVISAGEGRIHLALIQTLPIAEKELPEGIIYRQSVDEGGNWTAEAVLYPSRYFRSIKPTEANIQIAVTGAGESEAVYAVWDNTLLKRVFFARSLDGGTTWDDPVEIDGPAEGGLTGAPFRITVGADGNNVLLIWQGNLQSGIYCSQYYQSSSDKGRTWTARSRMLQNLTGCSQSNRLFRISGDALLLEPIIQDQSYLMAWDGEKWSEPQIQNSLYAFDNPVTNDPVTFRCRQSILVNSRRLVVAGCDESPGGDVWITQREVGSIDAWFPPPSRWSLPQVVATAETEIFDVQSLTDSNGRLHILWTQYEPAEDRGAVPTRRSIYYGLWDGSQASEPVSVVWSPDNYTDEFSLAYDTARDRIVVALNGGESGEIYYSWADVERATSALEWSRPVSVPVPHTLSRFPNIVAREDGLLVITYAVTINEDRGVYLVTSSDGGEVWSEPVRVYDAEASSWQAVSAPRMTLNADHSLHLLWSQSMVLADPGSLGVYYSKSTQAGEGWSELVSVFSEPVSDWWVLNTAAQGVHRFWMGVTPTATSIYHDMSMDDGLSWSLPGNLTGLDERPLAVSPYSRPDGTIALMQLVQDGAERLALKNQVWDGKAWRLEDNLGLAEKGEDVIHSLATGADPDGNLTALYVTHRVSSGLEDEPWEIMLFQRHAGNGETSAPLISTQAVPASTEPVETPAPTAESELTPTVGEPTLAPTTPSQAASAEASPTPPVVLADTPPVLSSSTTTLMGLVLAGGVALVVVFAFVAFARLRRRP